MLRKEFSPWKRAIANWDSFITWDAAVGCCPLLGLCPVTYFGRSPGCSDSIKIIFNPNLLMNSM